MPPKPKFSEGEKVLCFHGPLIYEAKCLKSAVTKDSKQVKYFIHYAGWNKNWDEWVPETRVLKYNDANVARQKEVQKAHSTQPSTKSKKTSKSRKTDTTPSANVSAVKDSSKESNAESRASTPNTEVSVPPVPTITEKTSSTVTANSTVVTTTTPSNATTSSSTSSANNTSSQNSNAKSAGTKRSIAIAEKESTTATTTISASAADGVKTPAKKRSRIDPSVESEEQFLHKVEVKIKIPDELKPWLVDDWDAINRLRKLVKLPAKTNVDTILQNYVDYKKAIKSSTAHKEQATQDITAGIREYFNVMLGTQLLYMFEKPQYAEILEQHPGAEMSSVYGAIHLLRLFVKLGGMLAYTPLNDRSVQLLLQNITDFLKYLIKNIAALFSMQDYVVASTEYLRKVI